jgi:hypothetical protein
MALPTVLATFYLVGGVAIVRVAYSALMRWGFKGPWIILELVLIGSSVFFTWDLATTRFYSFPPFSWQVSIAIGAAYFVGTNLVWALVLASLVWWRRRNRADNMDGFDKVDTTESSHNGDGVDRVTGIGFSTRDLLSGWRRWVWLASAVATAYITAGLNVALYNPPLPEVEISGVKDMEGALLTHTEGFWYVFDVAGKNKGELIALRDDQVKTVTLSSKDK